MPLDRMVTEHVEIGGDRSFIVAAEGRPLGLLTLTDVARIPREDWSKIAAGEVMVAWDRVVVVDADAELLVALQMMDDAALAQLPVVSGGRLIGMLSRERVLHYLRAQAEIGR
jgi:CBS domain-containing protein